MEPPSRLIGQIISYCSVREKLGGGVGVLCKAVDIRLQHFVVLQLLPHGAAQIEIVTNGN
jgi:hypothetical protein